MMNVGAWNSLSKEQQSILVDTFNELEPQDFFRATEDAEKTNFAKWRELNGADTTPMLDASSIGVVSAPFNSLHFAKFVFSASSVALKKS